MDKGLKKFTVYVEGRYFDGGRLYGTRVKFAKTAKEAEEKVCDYFDSHNYDEPIMHVSGSRKWEPGDKSHDEIYAYWGMD